MKRILLLAVVLFAAAIPALASPNPSPAPGEALTVATVEAVTLAPFSEIGFATTTVHYIRLTWTNSTSLNVTQTDIYRAPSTNSVCGAMVQIAVSPVATPSYDDATAVQGTSYCYTVRAFNGVDESPDSNVAQATIPFPPLAPTGLGAVPK